MIKKIIPMLIAVVIGFVVGFFVGQEYTKNRIANELKKAFSQQPSVETANQEEKRVEEQMKKAIIKNIGDEIELATLKIKINSSKEENIIQSTYGQPKVADEGAKFVILNMTVTNITKAPFSFGTSGLVLADDKDTIYNSYRETIGNIDNYLDVQEISPNIPKTGVIVFQLPKDIEIYSFIVGKAGTDEIYKIRVK